jgi:hypothetical protein
LDEFLVDFGNRWLAWVIGWPESISIPASIEELGPFYCSAKGRVVSVEFASDSTLRSIGPFAFAECQLLESICIPASVEVIRKYCFFACLTLRIVTIGGDSKLRLIEEDAFDLCRLLESVSVPASVKIRI